MEENTRINLVVGADIPDKLSELAGGERKRGEYITQLIRAIHSERQFTDPSIVNEQFKLIIAGLIQSQKELERRVLTLEELLSG